MRIMNRYLDLPPPPPPSIPDLLVGAAAKYYHILGRVAKHVNYPLSTV